MYQWTHIELSRQQQNRPKKEFIQSAQMQINQETNNFESNNTLTVASNGCTNWTSTCIAEKYDGCEDTFATIKNKLFSCEVNGKIELSDAEISKLQSNNGSDTGNGVKHDDVQIMIADKNDQLENGQLVQGVCDSNTKKIFIETSTQTEDSIEAVPLKKSPETVSTPPPPPPPPPPFGFNSPLNNTSNDKFIPNEISIQQTSASQQISHNNSQNVPLATILSSASSFCKPPPPPLNGIPGPPPLPLPTEDMWFKSDSEQKLEFYFTVFFFKQSFINCVIDAFSTALRKAAKHPAKPMINLFWTRILIPKDEEEEEKAAVAPPPQVEKKNESETNTLTRRRREKLWQKIDETILENADDFTELFARQATPKRPREVTKVPKKTVIKVLDYKRSQ